MLRKRTDNAEPGARAVVMACARAAGIALVLGAPVAAQAATSDSTTGALTGTIIRPILVTASQALQFGAIVRPSSGSGTVTLSNGGALSVTGTGAIALPSSVSNAAMFTVLGEGQQSFTLTIDSSVTLTNTAASGGTLAVSTTNDAGCTTLCTLGGVLGANGTLIFHVGGSFPFSSATHTGTYSGTLNVLVTYN
jgi:hypothetical protein